MSIKSQIRSYIPESMIILYHKFLANLAAFFYNYPSGKMVVIGITGTKGKTSTANYIWSVLNAGGHKTGLIGTANIRIGDIEHMNEYHMTMPGPFVVQRMLAGMQRKGCTHVIMEVTSEGIKLNRHKGIIFDIVVFTNLTPEHLPSHGGSFENYKNAKKILFESFTKIKKIINGNLISKVMVVNTDNEYANEFLAYPADKKVTYGVKSGDILASGIILQKDGASFVIGNDNYRSSITGVFNVFNALPAIIIGEVFGIPKELIKKGVTALTHIPGRMEVIDQGQPFFLYIDYAHEKISMNLLLDTAQSFRVPGSKIIVLLGAEGGGRDKAKRVHMGHAVGEKADIVIVSNVDPYEDDPLEIAEGIAIAVREKGKHDGVDLFVILDRLEGIRKALSLAQKNDIVLITGKGSEQSMIIGGKQIPWDDRNITRELLKEIGYHGT